MSCRLLKITVVENLLTRMMTEINISPVNLNELSDQPSAGVL